MSKNIAEFRIIGRIGRIDGNEKVSHVSVAANYNRRVDGEWKQDTLWNRVTLFGKQIEYAGKAKVGDLVHITGRVSQSSYDNDGGKVYTVDLVAETFSVLTSAADD